MNSFKGTCSRLNHRLIQVGLRLLYLHFKIKNNEPILELYNIFRPSLGLNV